MAKCEICGKGPQTGFNVSHSKRHTKRSWKPNIRRSLTVVAGEQKRANICSRCLRTQRKVTQ